MDPRYVKFIKEELDNPNIFRKGYSDSVPEEVKKYQQNLANRINYYKRDNGVVVVWHERVVYLLNQGAKGKLFPDDVLDYADCYARMLKEPEHSSPDMQDYILAKIEKFEKRYGIKVARPVIDTNRDIINGK